jgi:hypothetical protein
VSQVIPPSHLRTAYAQISVLHETLMAPRACMLCGTKMPLACMLCGTKMPLACFTGGNNLATPNLSRWLLRSRGHCSQGVPVLSMKTMGSECIIRDQAPSHT